MLFFILIGITLIFGLQSTDQITTAQDDTAACDTLIESALQEVANTCINIGRNEICYGFDPVSAVLRDDTLFFDAPGDIVPVTAIESIITRPSDPDTGEWGIALMDVQADLPTDDSIRIVLFGGVDLAPAVEAPTDLPTCTFVNTSGNNLNMRAVPDLDGSIVDILDNGDDLEIYGQSGDWLRSSRGWVFAPIGTLDCGSVTLTEITDTADAYTAPMQAFTLQVDEAARCQAAPSGLMIQSPEGQTANLMVNSVELRVGSTALVTMTDDNGWLVVNNYAGDVSMTVGNETTSLSEDTQAGVPIADNEPAGPPSAPQETDGFAADIDPRVFGTITQDSLPGGEETGSDSTDGSTVEGDAIVSTDQLNVRAEPGTGAAVVAVVTRDTPLTILARLPDGSWVQVSTPSGTTGWVLTSLLDVTVDLGGIPVEDVEIVTPEPEATPEPSEEPPPQEHGWIFTVDRTSIMVGECVTFNWSAPEAIEMRFQGSGVGNPGSAIECPSSTADYTALARWEDGYTATQTITITVTGGYGY